MWSDHTLMLLAREKQAQYMEEARQERLLKELRHSQPQPVSRATRPLFRINILLYFYQLVSGRINKTKSGPALTKSR
jgi:hypothetical protein